MIDWPAFRKALDGAAIVPVLTVATVEHAAPLANALVRGGLKTAEVTLRTPVAGDVIREMKRAAPSLIVGAGTICGEGDINVALKAGADFLVSPGTGSGLLGSLADHNGVVLPGVSTVSEAMNCFEQGYGVLKFFPASASGGPQFLKAVSAALPYIDFVPTGGINPQNARDYLDLPNVIAVGGTWIAPQQDMVAGDWMVIEDNVREAVSLCRKEV